MRSPAGMYRNEVEVWLPSQKKDAFGSAIDDWILQYKRRAKITPLGGGERVIADQLIPVNLVEFRMPWWDGLTASHELRWRGVRYGIDLLENVDGLDREWRAQCTGRQESGALSN